MKVQTLQGSKDTLTNLGGYHPHEGGGGGGGGPIYLEICHREYPISRGDQNLTTPHLPSTYIKTVKEGGGGGGGGGGLSPSQ